MSNSISLSKNYSSILDEVYSLSALSSILDCSADMVKEGGNANEIIIPKLQLQGLGNYSRNEGYIGGDVTLTHETVAFNYERGRMFTVDSIDSEESAICSDFGKISGEFIRTKVAPEIDAFRFSQIASTPGISKASQSTLSTGQMVIDAICAAVAGMDEAEVPSNDRILFITPTLYNLAMNVDITKSKSVFDELTIVKVPSSRFFTKISLKTGGQGQEDGGYVKDTTAKDINFLLIHKSAIIQFTKHAEPKIITPDANQNADAWKFGYRIYGISDVYDNKLAGVYLHSKA